MYFEAAPSGSSLAWNFTTWQADVVLIALGTNDNPGSAQQAAFQAAYTGFLTSLRTYYPNAYILCTEPVPTWMTATCGTYISNVVNAFADPKVIYIPVRNTPIAAGFPLQDDEFAMDHTHPLVATHTKIANAMKAWIDTNVTGLGW
jgi:lysophospholipase L1-like esterase